MSLKEPVNQVLDLQSGSMRLVIPISEKSIGMWCGQSYPRPVLPQQHLLLPFADEPEKITSSP